jgi:hypothetical protein
MVEKNFHDKKSIILKRKVNTEVAKQRGDEKNSFPTFWTEENFWLGGPGWPDEFEKKIAQKVVQPSFCQT